jgi:DNA-binding NarL/FixJ family response regulator
MGKNNETVNNVDLVLIEDHALVREGFRLLIQNIPGVRIVGEEDNGRDALDLIKKLRPTVALVDITLPLLNGIELVSKVTSECPGVATLILSAHSDEKHVLAAIRAGAAGYQVKDATPRELEIAIRAVCRGETYLDPTISRYVIALCRDTADRFQGPLTTRQREILQLIAEGHTTKEIAAILDVSYKTIETHRTQIMERLEIENLAGLIRYAIRSGIVCA